MSEWQAHVHCTCFQKELTTEPPYPRSELTINRFGVVTMIASTDHAEDPEDLWNWRFGYLDGADGSALPGKPPCSHDHMQLVCAYPFYVPATWRRIESAYPQVESIVTSTAFPVLNELYDRHPAYDYPSGGIWVSAEESAPALAELSTLLAQHHADLAPGDAYFITNLQALLEASVQTCNPIIGHYNGVGDGAW